jgi:hypothetical protein
MEKKSSIWIQMNHNEFLFDDSLGGLFKSIHMPFAFMNAII